MKQPIGLYIHVPFCASKCPYCDFYSLAGQSDERLDAYTDAVVRALEQWHARLDNTVADTLYFGGGTPSLLGGGRLTRLIDTAIRCFGLTNAEITMEANPGDPLDEVFAAFAAAGGNRVSLGMQATNQQELTFLGRRHHPQDVDAAVVAAHAVGIENVSLDLMLGLAGQTVSSIVSAAADAARLGARHLSAYLLKVEEGTPFYQQRDSLSLPDDDTAAEFYLAACQAIEMLGFHQYEISNFAMPGFESRHNLKYWNADPYLGIGPSAHSFLDGQRFYYPRDLTAFLAGGQPQPEREHEEDIAPGAIAAASEQEYLMLRLRLNEGVTEDSFAARFDHPIPLAVRERASRLPVQLVTSDHDGVRLTRMGFLLSNSLIARLLDE